MTSLRHKTYLDAAREALLDVGWRRTTLTDVARRAGVSRMTIYRAWPDMESLLGDLMTREWSEMALSAEAASASDDTTPEAIAADVIGLIRTLRTNALFRRILDVDPELLLPYLLQRRGRSQQAILDILADRISRGQAAGTLAAGPPLALARTLLLTSHGIALSAHTMTDEEVTEAELDAGFVAFVTKALRP